MVPSKTVEPAATPTSAQEWKGKRRHKGQALPLPRGNTALVRQLSPTAFLESGFMPDPLTAIVREAIQSKKGLPPSAMRKMTEDPKQISEALVAFDRVLVFCVLEPSIAMPPVCIKEDCGEPYQHMSHLDVNNESYHVFIDDRDDEMLYADEVDMDDKQFIFQWALGGTSDLQQFRQEREQRVESLATGKPVRSATKRAPARKRA